MIECIFISDSSDRLLFGNHHTLSDFGYKASPEILNCGNSSNRSQKINYPVTYGENLRISHLKVNDIFLNVLYSNIDNFQASKYLLDLKIFLEDKIVDLDSSNILKNYFKILELLQTPDILFKSNKTHYNEDIFIDIVQNIHCNIIGDCVVNNSAYGELFLDQNVSGSLSFLFEKVSPLKIKSFYNFVDTDNKININCENPECRSLLSFHQNEHSMVYFKLKRLPGCITVESEYKGIFKFIEFVIPVGNTTFKVETTTSNGECEFKMKKGLLYWRIKDSTFKKETLKLNILSIEEETVVEPITVNFRIENIENSVIKIIKAENKSFPLQKYWVRNTVQNGYYELFCNEK